jgi:hypothetical protein
LISAQSDEDRACRAALVTLIDHAAHDASFRARLSQDPTRAVAGLGLELSPTTWAAVRILLTP